MKEYDIIVIGCGPAGSGAAKTAAERGLNVLVVEKRAEIGAPKRCGEGLSRSSLKRMGIEFDRKWVRREIIGASVYAPNGKMLRVDYKEGPEGWVIERKVFDKYLAEKAAEAGAKILAKTEATDVKRTENGITVVLESQGSKWKAESPLIIAADGVESKIARALGLNTTLSLTDVASSVQFEMTAIDIDPDRIELYFGNEVAPSGYAWIFPKGEKTANVGIGVRKPWAKKSALLYLQDFIQSKPGLKKGSILEVNSGGVPVGGLLENMVTDNLIVVGDAGHQVNPIHGGGISEGFIGGKLAAEIASQAFEERDFSSAFLEKYNKLWWEERGKALLKLLKLREVVERLSDEELNWLAEYLKGEDLIDLARSKGLKRFAKILMKKPKLIKLAKKLL